MRLLPFRQHEREATGIPVASRRFGMGVCGNQSIQSLIALRGQSRLRRRPRHCIRCWTDKPVHFLRHGRNFRSRMTPPATNPTERLFLEQLPTIDRMAGALARTRGLIGMDAEDFVAHVRARFVESQYAALVQHRGESLLTTYLTVVIARWLQDYMVARDGRWRPSATAARAGLVAVYLERLLTRDGYTIDSATTRLLTEGGHGYDEAGIRELARQLPLRTPLRPQLVAVDSASTLAGPVTADDAVRQSEQRVESAQAMQLLQDALSQLAPEDRLIVRMRYLDGRPVTDIGLALGVDAKPLYRRIDRIMATLRDTLEADGLSGAQVRDLFHGDESR